VCIGIGWNFLFVSGTTLLTETYRPEEKSKAQGFNDFLVFGAVAVFSFTAGYIQANFGWVTVNFFVLPWVFGVGAAVIWLKRQRRVGERAGSV
jgi:MFS family permease